MAQVAKKGPWRVEDWGMRTGVYAFFAAVTLIFWYLLIPFGLGLYEGYGWIWGKDFQTWEDDHKNETGRVVWSMYGSFPHWAQHFPVGIVFTVLPVLIVSDGLACLTRNGVVAALNRLSRRQASTSET